MYKIYLEKKYKSAFPLIKETFYFKVKSESESTSKIIFYHFCFNMQVTLGGWGLLPKYNSDISV